MMSQGWNIQDQFRNTSRDNMPMDETITSFGDRMLALMDQVIAEHGGKKMTVASEPVCRLKVEHPANLERLPGMKQELAQLRKQWQKEIEQSIVKGEPDSLARASYLAVCLDLAPGLGRDHPAQWAKALAALQSHAKVMQALFYESSLPAGDALRAKALAAGLVKPAEKIKLWTEN